MWEEKKLRLTWIFWCVLCMMFCSGSAIRHFVAESTHSLHCQTARGKGVLGTMCAGEKVPCWNRVWKSTCYDYEVVCDSDSFKINEITLVNGKVDTSELAGGNCVANAVSEISFILIHPNGGKETLCKVTYPGCNPGFQPQGQQQQCQCESSSGNVNNYQLRFFFNESFVGANLTIDSNCAPTGQHEFTYKPCGNLSPRPEPEPKCCFCQCSDCKDTGGCIGCIILFCFIGGICIAISCWFLCYYCCREKTENCTSKMCKCGCGFGYIDRCCGKSPPTNPGPGNSSSVNDKPLDPNGGHDGPSRRGDKPDDHSASTDGHP